MTVYNTKFKSKSNGKWQKSVWWLIFYFWSKKKILFMVPQILHIYCVILHLRFWPLCKVLHLPTKVKLISCIIDNFVSFFHTLCQNGITYVMVDTLYMWISIRKVSPFKLFHVYGGKASTSHQSGKCWLWSSHLIENQ